MMSDLESSSVKLEDGEIDEPSSTGASPTGGTCTQVALVQRSDGATNTQNKADGVEKISGKKPDTLHPQEPKKRSQDVPSSSKAKYSTETISDLVDEDEMLCVRGASPVPFPMERMSFPGQSPHHESDGFSVEIVVSPKRRKRSKKLRRKKRISSKKSAKERSPSSSDDNSKARDESQTSQQPKLQQLCKFYLQECCAKGRTCEYMHSEFPCKFFYMGLECEDEATEGKCKLSHGGTLSCEMLIALIRHIHTAPNDVLGKKFVELRSKMPAGEASKMLHKMQEKLQSPAKEEKEPMPATRDADFIATLREKLYFLSEEQIDKLQALNISKAEDLLNLTLAQLNTIGIHAIQIEAIQMSLVAGQDLDLRHIFPAPASAPVKPVEVVEPAKDAEIGTVGQECDTNDRSWYEDEQPLVIDESDSEDDNQEKVKSDDESDEVIDVVGISSCFEEEKTQSENSNSILGDSQSLGTCTPAFHETNEVTEDLVTDEENEIKSPDNLFEIDVELIAAAARNIDLKMQVGIPIDDVNAERQSSLRPYVQEADSIDSPDNSDNETAAFFSSGICPELPLPTPNLDNYTPALEIDAHLTYPAMDYKLYEIDLPNCEVNTPPLLDKLLKAGSTDPRLKKFLEKEKNYGIYPQTDYSFFPPATSHCDPRLRSGYANSSPVQCYNASPILYGYLQGSRWYQQLKSNLKIQINHSVSNLVRALNAFHKDPSPNKIFDLFQIECAGVLLEVMRNIGIFIDVKGNVTEEKNYSQLCAPPQGSQQFNNGGSSNVSSVSTSDNCGGSSGCPVGVPQLKPGLLGFAPPGIRYAPPHIALSGNEYSFIRQAFVNDYFGSNCSEFQLSGTGVYLGDRDFNRKRNAVDVEAVGIRRPAKRFFKRRL